MLFCIFLLAMYSSFLKAIPTLSAADARQQECLWLFVLAWLWPLCSNTAGVHFFQLPRHEPSRCTHHTLFLLQDAPLSPPSDHPLSPLSSFPSSLPMLCAVSYNSSFVSLWPLFARKVHSGYLCGPPLAVVGVPLWSSGSTFLLLSRTQRPRR